MTPKEKRERIGELEEIYLKRIGEISKEYRLKVQEIMGRIQKKKMDAIRRDLGIFKHNI